MYEHEIKCFKLAKDNRDLQKTQDACFLRDNRIAIADGVTQSLHAAKWAEILVTHFCQSEHTIKSIAEDDSHEWLREPQKEWGRFYRETLHKTDLPSFFKSRGEGNDFGSATFVGLELNPSKGVWECVAVGDSCMFIIRTDEMFSFPLDDLAGFKRSPERLHSQRHDTGELAPKQSDKLIRKSGKYDERDCFLLCTDAIAQWIFKNQQDRTKIQKLLKITTKDEYEQFIRELRSNDYLGDDDTTVVRITVSKALNGESLSNTKLSDSIDQDNADSSLSPKTNNESDDLGLVTYNLPKFFADETTELKDKEPSLNISNGKLIYSKFKTLIFAFLYLSALYLILAREITQKFPVLKNRTSTEFAQQIKLPSSFQTSLYMSPIDRSHSIGVFTNPYREKVNYAWVWVLVPHRELINVQKNLLEVPKNQSLNLYRGDLSIEEISIDLPNLISKFIPDKNGIILPFSKSIIPSSSIGKLNSGKYEFLKSAVCLSQGTDSSGCSTERLVRIKVFF